MRGSSTAKWITKLTAMSWYMRTASDLDAVGIKAGAYVHATDRW